MSHALETWYLIAIPGAILMRWMPILLATGVAVFSTDRDRRRTALKVIALLTRHSKPGFK